MRSSLLLRTTETTEEQKEGNEIKKLRVAASIIFRDGCLFAARRAYSPYPYLIHKFEFPGGKIEAGETPSQCVTRELIEEMDWTVSPIKEFPPYFHKYPDFEIALYPVLCLAEGNPVNKEHEELVWLSIPMLNPNSWAPADAELLAQLKEHPRTFME